MQVKAPVVVSHDFGNGVITFEQCTSIFTQKAGCISAKAVAEVRERRELNLSIEMRIAAKF